MVAVFGLGRGEGHPLKIPVNCPFIGAEPSMLSCSVPYAIRKVADQFKSVFAPGEMPYTALCAFFALSLYNCKGLSELARTCPWSPSVSELSRAIAAWNANRFIRRLRASVLRRFDGKLNPVDFCYAIDDTANPKYGNGIYGSGRWGGSGGQYNGQKILVVALVDRKRGIAIPIHYAFARKEGLDPDYKSMPMLAVDLLQECMAGGFPPLPVTCDSWFDSKDFMNALEGIGLSYDGEIKSTRNVKGNPGPNVKWRKLKEFFAGKERKPVLAKPYGERRKRKKRGRKKQKYIVERVVMISGVSHPVKMIAVYNNRRDKNAFAYYISTNRSMSGAELWALARSRWAIEVMFRDLKQNLAFGRLPCTGKEAADLAVCVPLALIVSLRLDDPAVWGLDKANDDAIGTMITKVREANLNKAIILISSNPKHRIVERLRARRQAERINQKPVNKTAASRGAHEMPAASGF